MAAALRRQLQRVMMLRVSRSRAMWALPERNPTSSSEELMRMEQQHSAHNYHPIPMVFSQAKGACIWDPEGNKYIDFLSAYSAVNQASYQRLLNKQGGKHAVWEYPFAVAGVNITFMIIQMLDLQSSKPRSFLRAVFLQMLSVWDYPGAS